MPLPTDLFKTIVSQYRNKDVFEKTRDYAFDYMDQGHLFKKKTVQKNTLRVEIGLD